MVPLTAVRSSNALISSSLPPGLVALFVGATSGIGEITLKKFAQYARQPRAYFVGRSQEAADRIIKECRQLNPEGEYIFMKEDISLISTVDKVCEEIKGKENTLNLICLSQGAPRFDRAETSEQLHELAALNYYTRMRFVTNLLPLLTGAQFLRRVLFVAGGTNEGPLDPTDFAAIHVPLAELRGHLTTLITLGLEAVAKTAPSVSFVHDYPGTVKTALFARMPGIRGLILRLYTFVLGPWVCVPIDESGERHLYLATSARYPPLEGNNVGVKSIDEVEIAVGTTGEVGSGVYSVGRYCEDASPDVRNFLGGLRAKGMVDEVWSHTETEFKRIMKADGKA